jgi:hypothetical protein
VTTPYVDPQSVHNPATGTSPPASWGDTVRDDLEFLIAPPSVKANRTASQSVAASSWTAIEFTAADSWDTDAFHSTTTNPSRLTVPTGLGGRYVAIAQLEMAAGTNTRALRLDINATSTIRYFDFYLSTSNVWVANGVLEVALAAGDYVELEAYQASAGALNVTAASLALRWVAR